MTKENFLNNETLREFGFQLIDQLKDLAKAATPCEKWVRTKENETTLVLFRWPEICDCTLRTEKSDRLTCANVFTKSDLMLAAKFHGITL